MADKRTRRREQKRSKDKARQKANRKKQAQRRRGGRATPEKAAHWNTGECWLSEGWDERGAKVHAVFVRVDAPTNRAAAAVVEVDLEEHGITRASVTLDLQPAQAQALVGRLSDQVPMTSTSPGQVVKVLLAGAEHGASRGHPPVKGFEEVRALIGELQPRGEDPLLGNEDEDGETQRKQRGGFWAGLKSRFGLG